MAGGTRGERGEDGQIIDGRFELLNQLGAGGMGTVWRARDTALHREVAIKEVRPPLSELGDPDWRPPHKEESQGSRALRERVLREARALARLSHPNVVTIHHIVDQGPYPWIVMELIPGSLEARLAERPLEPDEAARRGREVLGALRTSHAAGIQHRDVKPANVLLREDGSAVLTDFGIAALQGSATVTATGEFLGSPEYIAPERIRGTDDEPASDLWSLAMTLYVCTEGYSPLRRTTTLSTLAAVLDDPIPPPVRSGALAPVLEAVLVRDSSARPSAVELDRMLADVAEGRVAAPLAPVPPPPPPQSPPVPPTPRQPGQAQPSPTQPGQAQPGPAQHGQAQPGVSPVSQTQSAMAPGSVPHGQAPPGFGLPPGNGPDGGGKRRGRMALAAVGIVVVAALLAGGTYLATRPGADQGNRAAEEKTEQPANHSPSAGPTGNGGKTPTDPSRDGSDPQEKGEKPIEEPAKEPKPDKEPGEDAPDSKPGGGAPGDSWVAQLGSVAKSDGTGARDKMHSALRAKADGVRWVDSDRFASLRAGYWMFYSTGPASGFPSGHAAANWCSGTGLASSNQCVGRYVSDDGADRVYICAPDKHRGTGRCER